MNLKNLILGSAAAVMLTIAVIGCNENPTGTTGGNPAPPTALKANSASATSVNLTWLAAVPADTGVITYTVAWTGPTSGTADVASTSTKVINLTANSTYTFTVVAKRGTLTSTNISVTWAGADRFTTDASSGTTLKMYEFASSNGSAITVDPSKGGPKNVSTSASRNPTLSTCQLAMYIIADTIEIGPAAAIVSFSNVNLFDQNVFTSSNTYTGASIDQVFTAKSADQYIAANGNVLAYHIGNGDPNPGQAFFIRTGTSAANYHYAKVFIVKGGGGYIQGTSPNRYVEVVISYQSNINTPYAKSVVGKDSPIGTVGRNYSH